MDPVAISHQPLDLNARRMELRGMIRLASEVIARYWPMRTFVHHNPLHSLEYLPFTEAVRRGRQFLGGSGYLSGDMYRRYVRSGRILVSDIDDALGLHAGDREVDLGSCRISHHEVLRACLTHGLCTSIYEPLDRLMEGDPYEEQVDALAERLTWFSPPPLLERMTTTIRQDRAALGRELTLTSWCDAALGTQVVDLINGELTKWCEAFLDEGHATWPMPGREQGLYGAWRSLAETEWRTCGIAESRRKIASLPEEPEDAVFESLERLAIPATLRQDYLALQLAALPGWAGFIKWRAEENSYARQQAYAAGLVKFLAMRLWYARELVQKVCQEELGIDGNFRQISAYMEHHPHAYFMRKELARRRLPARYADRVERLTAKSKIGRQPFTSLEEEWTALTQQYQTECGPAVDQTARRVIGPTPPDPGPSP